MEFGTMLGDIVILLGAASLLGMLCERVGFSAIIGALLAGVLVGPGVLHAVATEPKEMDCELEIANLDCFNSYEIDSDTPKKNVWIYDPCEPELDLLFEAPRADLEGFKRVPE